MSILQITTDVTGQVGVIPRIVKILTTDNLATITATGYLTGANLQGVTIAPTDEIHIRYSYVVSTGLSSFGVFLPTISGNSITLSAWSNPGDVLLPVVGGNIALFNGTSGQIHDAGISPSDVTKSRIASVDASAVSSIAHFTDVNGTISSAAGSVYNSGNIQAGLSGTLGAFLSYPATAASGFFGLAAVESPGNFPVILHNLAMGQSTLINIPDPVAASASVLLNTGPGNIISDFQEFVGITGIILQTAGVWTALRNGAGDYVNSKAVGADDAIVAFDISPQIRLAASKGFRLASIDVIYGIATTALTTHTGALYQATYANNVADTITSIALTGSLATATQTFDYVTNLAVSIQTFLNTAVSKYVFEVHLVSPGTTNYEITGLNLHFNQTIA